MVPLLSTFNVGVKQSVKKLMEAADLAYTMKPFRIETERSHAGLICFTLNLAFTFSFHLSLCPSYTDQKCYYTVPPALVRQQLPPKRNYYNPPCLNKPLSLIYLHPPVSLN